MKKILIVDDDPAILDVTGLILTEHNYTVQTLADGINIEFIIKQFKPDLVLLDIILPGRFGTAICKGLKRIFTIPIVLFSADLKAAEEYLGCKADDFIAKPFDINCLLSTIKKNMKDTYKIPFATFPQNIQVSKGISS